MSNAERALALVREWSHLKRQYKQYTRQISDGFFQCTLQSEPVPVLQALADRFGITYEHLNHMSFYIRNQMLIKHEGEYRTAPFVMAALPTLAERINCPGCAAAYTATLRRKQVKLALSVISGQMTRFAPATTKPPLDDMPIEAFERYLRRAAERNVDDF